MAELTHEEMVILIAKNADRTAFKTLYLHYAPRLKSYLLNFKISENKAEELAQETMITLWQKASKFDAEKAKLSTWLFRIARNKFIDLTRKQKYPTVNADDHLAEMVAPEQTDKPVEAAQTAKTVQEAMATLDPKLKAVIELSFFEELSHSAIAEKLDLPLGTVKSRIRKAFEMLRREIGDVK